MASSDKLTILIPTYNRADVLEALMEMLYQYQTRGLEFSVLVSDDCSTDSTPQVCRKWQEKIQHLHYTKTEANMGMDNNFRTAYEACETDYCWMLGDTRYITFEEMQSLIAVIQKGAYDAFILKCRDEAPAQSQVYTDINKLMSEQGWQITNNASCVIPKKFISKDHYNRYMGTTFLHQGIFVEGLCMLPTFKVKYLSDVRVKDLRVGDFRKVGWTRHPFLNFGKLWYTYVMSLPNQLTVETKQKVIMDHNRFTHILDLTTMPGYKNAYKQVFVKSYHENRKYVKYVVAKPVWMYDLMIALPSSVFRIAKAVYRNIKPVKQT